MNAHEFATHIHGVKRSGGGYVGHCPGHEDQRASLSFRDGDKGVLAKCHAGCEVDSITAALGLSTSDLFTDTLPQRIEVAHYPYHDEAGMLLYEAVRYIPKDFRLRRPDGSGGWAWDVKDVRRVLYRLPYLKAQPTAYIVEGEKDADRLVSLGIPATTSATGSTSWRDEYGDQLVSVGIQRVVIIPDNDPSGEGYAVDVATTCLTRGMQVKIVRLPGLSDKGDVTNWLDAGHPLSELADLVRATPLATRETLTAPRPAPQQEMLITQDGDGYRCEWAGDRVGIRLSHLTEHRAGLHAEATVYRLSTIGEWADRLQWTILNLSSSTAKSGLAKILSATAKGKGVDWATLLDAASMATAEAVRAPSPVIDLATVEPSQHERFAVEPLLSLHETNILYGDGDSGKSYLALALGMAVAGQQGNTLTLPQPIRPVLNGPVLYLDYETCADELTDRLHALALGGDLYPLPSIHYRAAHRPLTEDLSNLKADIQRLGIQLLIVDSMAPACGGKPDDAETALKFMSALRSLGPVTRLVICHVAKSEFEKKRAKIFGSVFTRNMARQCWEVRASRVGEALTVGLFLDKFNRGKPHKPIGLTFTWQDKKCILATGSVIDNPELSQSADPSDRIVDALKAGPLTVTVLSQELDMPFGVIKKRLAHMPNVCPVGVGRGNAQTWGLLARGESRT